MGNTAAICTYIDACNAICDKDQILFNISEWDDPIVLENSQRNQVIPNNRSKKLYHKRKNGSIGKSSMNDVELMNKNNRNSLFNSNINTNTNTNTNMCANSTTQNSKINYGSSLYRNNNMNNSYNNIVVVNAHNKNKNNFQNQNNIQGINNKNFTTIQENENKSYEEDDEKNEDKQILEQT